ncbi:MAG TPA: uroporphyrinogen-III C-methyltransferase [Gammaproteobacteria bacterium]
MSKTRPIVYLVGSGPGDPDLLTVKALRLIQQADVVVYDRLVSDEILALIPAGIKKVFVGKASGNHHMKQEQINKLLVTLAKTNRSIVRLKGGDPFIFGRGSEEALFLLQHDIDFDYVPGITAASAVSAYAGIPLTHRGIARSVRLITGHCQANQPLELNWNSLADRDTTLVFYMGLANLEQLQQELIKAGLPATTPAAVVENGTTSRQRRCISTLTNLQNDVNQMSIKSPALIIIGEVVSLADELNWFTPQSAEDDFNQQVAEN